MNLNQLRYFVEVAETNSFTQASENLFITQPSLSVSIQKLEKNLGVKLINRGKNMILTSSGKYLLEHSKVILAEVELLERKLRRSCENKNILRIGILHSLSISAVLELISSFSKVYSNILIEQISGSMMELEEWLEKKSIDLAFGIFKESKKDYLLQRLFSQNYQVTVSKNHPLAQKKSLSFSDLDGLPYIERVQCEIRDDLQSLFAAKKVMPKVVCRTVHDQLSHNLVLEGKGIAIMPVREKKSNILHLPFSDVDLTRQVFLISKSNNNSEAINLFYEFL